MLKEEEKLCEKEMKKNLVLAELGMPLTISLAQLNRSCEFRKEWNKIQNKWHGISKEVKEYQQRPEIKAQRKEYRNRPEVKIKAKEYRDRSEIKVVRKIWEKEYYKKLEVKIKRKEYMKKYYEKNKTKI